MAVAALGRVCQQLPDSAYQPVLWPAQTGEPRAVYVHVVSTRVRTLYPCQVIMVRERLQAEPRFWAASRLGG